jgi:hypothetical protein
VEANNHSKSHNHVPCFYTADNHTWVVLESHFLPIKKFATSFYTKTPHYPLQNSSTKAKNSFSDQLNGKKKLTADEHKIVR